VQLELKGDKVGGGTQAVPMARPVALFGPGDIVGIDRRAIVRVEPRDWVTNFEPNYLPFIEFYDEDFPWRYTPAAPDLSKGRLRPWITLVVLQEGEFTEGKNIKDRPLPFVDVGDLNLFPRADELWAWAHVHVNESLAASDAEFVSTDMNAVIPKLTEILTKNPDRAYSRVVCPRRLEPKKAYHAFLVPTFEPGRRAGLGLELGDVPATMSAWDSGTRPEGQSFPVYHRWFFQTGESGDFETLVRLLKPAVVNPRVGRRDMDVQFPGSNVSGVDNPALDGILKLGGALRPPGLPEDIFDHWDDPFPRPLEVDLAHLLNLSDDYQLAGDPDPIITPPLYGTWHALTKRVLFAADGSDIPSSGNWIHRLNLDPRYRVAAGFGTRVIQDQQEQLMDAAWEQVGDVLEAQRRIRFGRLGVQVSDIWYDSHLMPMLGVSQQKTLLMIAPLNKRIITNPVTLHHLLGQSFVQPPMTSAALRRLVRPRGRTMRLLPFDASRAPDQLLGRVNAGEVSASPPKVAPAGVLTFQKAARLVAPSNAPSVVLDWLRRFPGLPVFLLVVAILLALLLFLVLTPVAAAVAAAAIIGAGAFAYQRLSAWNSSFRASEAVLESSQTPEFVDTLPEPPGFVIPPPAGAPAPGGSGGSGEASRFKRALRESFEVVQVSAAAGAVPVKRSLDLARVTETALSRIDPGQTIPRRIRAGIFLPARILAEIGERFVEPMAYPVIDLPMYDPLTKLSSELFLPNINLIEQNTVTLLETNQPFIEAYMVGLNHEFARELLWREYPTDQRGSTFRQFWDVRSFFNAENLEDDALKEKLRDIPPLHKWSLSGELGDHDHREAGGDPEDELVLVIRGELLKRYPTAVIYAHRACWQRKGDGSDADAAKEPCLRAGGIDPSQERRLAPLTPAEEATPPLSKVRTPLYEAKVAPDIYFFGFDLTEEEAKGGTGANPDDDPGWFFVIKERPGEPRFGLDNEKQPQLNVWNDLSWKDLPTAAPGNYIEVAAAPASFPLQAPGTVEQEKNTQHADDVKVTWSHNMSSAELAYILYQAPVLVGVHASEMLPK
jgi:hypothetical protein